MSEGTTPNPQVDALHDAIADALAPFTAEPGDVDWCDGAADAVLEVLRVAGSVLPSEPPPAKLAAAVGAVCDQRFGGGCCFASDTLCTEDDAKALADVARGLVGGPPATPPPYYECPACDVRVASPGFCFNCQHDALHGGAAAVGTPKEDA